MAETKQANVTAEPERVESAPANDYIEYMGEEPHGTSFLTSHTLPRGDGLWKRAGITVSKEVTWERDPMGPGIGQKGNRMLVRVEDLPDGALAVLEKTPGYKRVSD